MYKRMMKREAGDAESSSRDAWAFIAAGIQGSRLIDSRSMLHLKFLHDRAMQAAQGTARP